MALDEPKSTDDSFEVKGHKFVVDKEFMEKVERIKIDFTGMGFHLDSDMELGASGCGSCSSGGSCGD